MPKYQDLSRSLAAFDQNSTLVAVIEMGSEGWLVGALVPGLKKDPRKKLSPDKQSLLALLHRWCAEAAKAGHAIKRVCVAYEAGRDGVWLARWLREQDIDAYVIHPTSIPVSREHRRAKSDRLDLRLLLRAFLGWLRGEPGHCSMVAIPTVEEEDGKRPLRERETLTGDVTRLINRMKSLLVTHGIRNFKVTLKKAGEKLAELKTAWGEPLPPESLAELQRSFERLRQAKQQIAKIDKARRRRLEKAPEAGVHPMILILARVYGVGLMTAKSLVREVLYRNLRDRRAVARYVGLTGSPDGRARNGASRVLPRPATGASDERSFNSPGACSGTSRRARWSNGTGRARRRPPRHPQGDDRGAGAQAPGGVLGTGDQRKYARGHAASSSESRRVRLGR